MNLISYTEFGKLRLHQFEPTAEKWEVEESDSADLEFMGSYWFDEEVVPYVEFMHHEDDPKRVGAVSLHLDSDPPDLVNRILSAIHLPLRSGMTLQEVTTILGTSTDTGLSAFDFICGSPDQYLVRCWLDDDDGLTGVDIIRKDLLPDDHAA